MKLLTKNEIKNTKRVQLSREVSFANKVHAQTNKERKKLNDVKSYVESETEKVNADYGKFLKDIQTKKSELRNEVLILEKRKKVALEPIKEIQKEAKSIFKKNEKVQEDLSKKGEALDIQEIKHGVKDKDIKDKSNELKDRELSLNIREKEIKEGENDLKDQENLLGETTEKERKIRQDREKELRQAERVVKQKDESLRVLGKELEKGQKKLADDLIRLYDQRATLDRAFKRIKK